MASQHSIHRRGRNGSPSTAHNRDPLPLELSRPRRQAQDACRELTEGQEDALRLAPTKAGNLKREEVALWLFIVAIAIISLLAGYFLWAKLSLHSPS